MDLKIKKEFSWDIQQCVQSFFKVTGTCTPPNPECNPDAKCPTMMIITITACDINDLCRKLQKKNLGIKIQSIEKFTRPAFGQSDVNPTCVSNVPLPNPIDCGDCCSLLDLPASSSSASSGSPTSVPCSSCESSSVCPSCGGSSSGSCPSCSGSSVSSSGGSLLGLEENKVYRVPNRFFYIGDGLMTLTSATTYDSSDEGTIPQSILFVASTQGEQGFFATESAPAAPLPLIVQPIGVDCCGAPLPNILQFKHNLDRIDTLAAFLKVNNLSLPGVLKNGVSTDFIKLNYSKVQDFWVGKVHFSGQSPFGSYQEDWDISTQFGCDSDVQESGAWRFSLVLVNKTPSGQNTARLLVFFDVPVVCPDTQSFSGFDFSLNISTGVATPNALLPFILNDITGIFRKSQSILLHPNMDFRIIGNIGVVSDLEEIDLSLPFDTTLVVGT